MTYQNGSFYGVIGIQLWSAVCAQFDWMPLLNRFFRTPDCDVAAATQCVAVFGPVGRNGGQFPIYSTTPVHGVHLKHVFGDV